MIKEIRCPECHISGRRNINSMPILQQGLWGNSLLEITCCISCGHIYGVFQYSLECDGDIVETIFFKKKLMI